MAYKVWPLSEAGPVERREVAPERLVHRSACEDAASAAQRSAGPQPWNVFSTHSRHGGAGGRPSWGVSVEDD